MRIYDEQTLREWVNQPRLRDFRFPEGARFEIENPPDFSRMGYLQFLTFKNSELPAKLLASIAELPILRRLDLTGCTFDKRDFAVFCDEVRSPKLTDLWLANTPIDDNDLAAIAQIPTLQSLDLTETAITDAGLPSLLALAKLRHLYLRNTATSLEAVLQLAALPHLSSAVSGEKQQEAFYRAHLIHHTSKKPVDENSRNESFAVLKSFLREMGDWEIAIVRESSAIKKRFYAQRPQSHVMAPEEWEQTQALWERASQQKAEIVSRFCTSQLASKVSRLSSYGFPPKFDPGAENWVDVEAKSKTHLLFYSLARHNRWRRYSLKQDEEKWRLDGVQWFFDGGWKRDFY